MVNRTEEMMNQFFGIPIFLKLPWIRNKEELEKVKPNVACYRRTF